MDSPQLPTKPPGQTMSLNSSYRQHNRVPSVSSNGQHLQRWPLRVVDDNSPLQHATTGSINETKSTKTLGTADCLYTTSPPGYQSGSHRQTPRHRRYPVDAGYAGRQKSVAYEEGLQGYDRRYMRSYRDTASEIISLYAASNPPSYTQAAPGSHADASRAYSMSAAYARQAAAQRHPLPMQTSVSIGGLPGARSPAPYPARLRRPGTRPSSPTATEDGVASYNRVPDADRVSQRTLQASYKTMYSQGPRRPPPLALRADLNRSTSSLLPGASPGSSHYATASGRARTPSSSVSWASRPSDRYYVGSTDPSIRSASLTSIVEMYQRPMTATRSCPQVRPSGLLYYDYSEEFKKQNPAVTDIDPPVCPIPKRVGNNGHALILTEESQSRLDDPPNASCGQGAAAHMIAHSRSGDLNSIDESCDTYMEDIQGESMEEIERVLANALSSAAPDHGLLNTIRATEARYSQQRLASANMQRVALRDRTETGNSTSANDWAIPQKAWRQSTTIAAEPGYGQQQTSNRTSQTSLCKKDFALDPVFADFTSLLSSFERLAKSPFSRLSDEDDMDEESKHLSRRLTMELLDRVAAGGNNYQRCHRRNRLAREIAISELASDESLCAHPNSSAHSLALAPEPLSPSRQQPANNGQDLKLMKALPPLPMEKLPMSCGDDEQASETGKEFTHEDCQVKAKPPQSAEQLLKGNKSPQNSPTKLKIRVNASRSSIDADALGDGDRGRSQRSSMDGNQTSSKPPPRLKLKVSRNQLHQGSKSHGGSIVRNHRLKQCNAFADVAPSPRRGAGDGKQPVKDGTLEAIEDEARRSSSDHLSDQFNLVYPPTLPETAEPGFQTSSSTGHLITQLPASRSEVAPAPSHRLRSKFSFLRPRVAAAEPTSGIDETGRDATLKPDKRAASVDGQHHPLGKSVMAASTSAKSERVRVRMKRWATGAKCAVRSYVRRTLVRAPKVPN